MYEAKKKSLSDFTHKINNANAHVKYFQQSQPSLSVCLKDIMTGFLFQCTLTLMHTCNDSKQVEAGQVVSQIERSTMMQFHDYRLCSYMQASSMICSL